MKPRPLSEPSMNASGVQLRDGAVLLRKFPPAITVIVRGIVCSPEKQAAIDTGTALNWVSKEVAQQVDSLITGYHGSSCISFDGSVVNPVGMIELRWHKENGSRMHNGPFLVVESPPFDLLLGRIFLEDHGAILFNDVALILVHLVSPAERAHMNQSARQQEIENERLIAQRESQAATKRKQEREAQVEAASQPKLSINIPSAGVPK
ncbi:MAG: hypothetical protein M1827_007476 [Pycnora praestabilis]|nr:MAG: hypothetical protein M1827_007476 [Pycnora praestabilis]